MNEFFNEPCSARLREAHLQSERRLSQIIEFLPDPTFVRDTEGRVLVWNRAMEALTCVPASDMLGKGDFEYALPFYGERRPILIDLAIAAAADPDPDIVKRYHYLRKEHGVIFAETFIPGFHKGPVHLWGTAAPLYDADGKVAGAIESIRDVTLNKLAEEERQKLQLQLQQAMKMEAVGRLAGGVAHDFNNLLTGISGNLSLAMMDLPPEHPLPAILLQASKAADIAASVTRQLLVFSRKRGIEPRIIKPNELIEGMHGLLNRLLGEDVLLETALDPGVGSIRTDPGQLEQIIVNLAVNARDAMPEGGRLLIETDNVTIGDPLQCRSGRLEAGDYVALRVRDTGVGMGAQVLEHLFEPFFTTKPKGHGTGLGLATTYGAVKQYGGEIDVRSTEGEGTAFTIYFPMLSTSREKTAEAASTAAALPSGSETILFVEDDRIVHEFMSIQLRRLGYRVIPAFDGESAVRSAAAYDGRIDLLLTDVVMPGMDGPRLARKLREMRPELPVLCISGYTADVVSRHHFGEEGMAFLPKPCTPRELALKLRELLEARPASR